LEISNILKYTFLFHFIVSIVFGFVFFLIPEFYSDAVGWPFTDPAATRGLGSAFIGFAITSLFGYMANSWEEVKLVVIGEIVFTLFGLLSMVWVMVAYTTIPALLGWFYALLFALFFVLFLYSYFTTK
jgi:hypothetical protein